MTPQKRKQIAAELNRLNERLEEQIDILRQIAGIDGVETLPNNRVGSVASDAGSGEIVEVVFNTTAGDEQVTAKTSGEVEEGDIVVVNTREGGRPVVRRASEIESATGIDISGTAPDDDKATKATSLTTLDASDELSGDSQSILHLGSVKQSVGLVANIGNDSDSIVLQDSNDKEDWHFLDEITSSDLPNGGGVFRLSTRSEAKYVRAYALNGFSDSEINHIVVKSKGL